MQADLIQSTIYIILNAMGIFALMLILAYSVWGEEEED
jgi:hypothetical protein